ncbi:MAG: hypothetical protein WBC91_03825 [Phototrophicaceae bacterium]
MQVRDNRQQKVQQISRWWARTKQYTQLSHRLAQGSARQLSRITDFDLCIQNLQAQTKAIETIPYPESASGIRKALLAFMLNITTATQHARFENDDDRNVIFDIALIDKNMVDIYLSEVGLSL